MEWEMSDNKVLLFKNKNKKMPWDKKSDLLIKCFKY